MLWQDTAKIFKSKRIAYSTNCIWRAEIVKTVYLEQNLLKKREFIFCLFKYFDTSRNVLQVT